MTDKVKTLRPELPFQWACHCCAFYISALYEKDLEEGIERHRQKCEAEKKATRRGGGMKHLYFSITLILGMSDLTYATTCEDLGLYAFSLGGCPYSELGVDTSIPLCEQERWKHLAWLDDRCYQLLPNDSNCTQWDCPTPYDRVLVEPISGKKKTVRGPRELVDWNYRACRQGYGQAVKELRKKKR